MRGRALGLGLAVAAASMACSSTPFDLLAEIRDDRLPAYLLHEGERFDVRPNGYVALEARFSDFDAATASGLVLERHAVDGELPTVVVPIGTCCWDDDCRAELAPIAKEGMAVQIRGEDVYVDRTTCTGTNGQTRGWISRGEVDGG